MLATGTYLSHWVPRVSSGTRYVRVLRIRVKVENREGTIELSNQMDPVNDHIHDAWLRLSRDV
jgi:hypothetical protein